MVPLPKAILFDLDDTILATGSREGALIEVAEEFAPEFPDRDPVAVGEAIEVAMLAFWSNGVRCHPYRHDLRAGRAHLVTELFATWGLPAGLARRFANRFSDVRDTQVPVCYPNAVETIDELRRRGVRLALITNGPAEFQRAKVDHFDLARRFDHVQIEGEIGFGKPETRAYRHAMAALGVRPEETWMVGDHLEWEVAAPQRLGIYAIWHDHTGKGLPAFTDVRPDRIVRSIAELLDGGSSDSRYLWGEIGS